MEEQAYQQRVMELQRLNRALRFLSSVNQVLLHATTEAELLQQACQIAVEVGEYRMAWVGLAEYDAACSVRPICHAGHEDGYLTAVPISWSDHEAGHEPTGTAIRTGQPEMQPDIAYAPEQAPWREAALTRGYRSVIALPVFIDTHVIGAFTLFGDTTQAFTAEDIQLLMALASDLGYGITALRTREQQRQAVDELRDSEEKYRRLHESMTDAFVRVDMTGRIVESNLAYQQMLGYTAEELAHLHYPDLTPAQWHATEERIVSEQVLVRGYSDVYEKEYIRKDGTVFPIELRAVLLRDAAGAPVGMWGIVRDITERKRAEEALRESEERLSLIINNSPDLVFVLDERLRYSWVPKTAAIFTREAVFGKTDHDLFPPAEADRLDAINRRVMATGESVRYEMTLPAATGLQYYDNTALPWRDGQGRMMGVVVYAHEVTERKQNEAALRKSLYLNERIIDTTPNLIYIYDLVERRNIYANKEITTFLGYTPEEVQRMGPAIMPRLLHPDDAQRVAEYQAGFVDAVGNEIRDLEYRMRHANGQWRWIHSYDTPFLRDDTGKVVQVLGTVEDFTERKEAEDAVQQSEEKYKFLFDTMAQGVVLQDAATRIIEANRAASVILGVSMDQLRGSTSFDPRRQLIHEDYSPFAPAEMPSNIALRTGQPVSDVVCGVYLPEDDDYHWLIITSVPKFKAGDDKPYVTMTTFTDITNRKRAEEALSRARDLAQQYLDVAGVILIVIDADQRVSSINEKGSEVMGYAKADIIGRNWYDTFVPEDIRETVRAASAQLMAGEIEPVEYFENPILTKNGEQRLIAWHNTVLRTASGNITGTLSSGEDITERRQAEDALRKSESLLQAIQQLAHIGGWEYQAATRTLYWTSEVYHIHEVNADYDPNDVSQNIRFYAPQDQQIIEQAFTAAVTSGTSYDLELQFITAKGRQKWVMTTARAEVVSGAVGRVFGNIMDITERKQAEEALRASEAQFRSLFDAMTEGVALHELVHDADGTPVNYRIIDINPAYTRQTGIAPEQAQGALATELYHTPTPPYFDMYLPVAETGKPYAFETYFPPMRKYYAISVFSPGPNLFATVFEDITERRRAEEALREQEALLRAIIEHAPFEFWARNLEGQVIMENRALVEHWGDLLGQRPEDTAIRSDVLTTWQENNRRALAGEVVQGEVSYTVAGEQRVFQNIVAPIYAGQDIQGIMGFNIDITEIKRAEDAVKRERAYLASAIELLPFPILFITPTLQVIRQNRASLELLREPNGHHWWGIALHDPQTHLPLPEQEWPMLRALHGETMPTTEWILALPDGQEIPILLQSAPVFVDHEFIAAVVTFQDITVLKEADRAKNQFLNILSHEVKTPLTSIIGWAQLAQDAPDVVPEALAVILRNAHEQKELLERLLILSRILTGKLVLTRTPIDLWQLALLAVQRVRQAAEERQITISLIPPEGELSLTADGKLLEQAIREVLDNAVHATANGGVISLQGRQEQETLRFILAIHDTGPGIAPEQLSLLAKPFTQLLRQEEIGGLGIGLALARGIMEAHGGRLRVESAGPERGTTVTLWLPRAVDDESEGA